MPEPLPTTGMSGIPFEGDPSDLIGGLTADGELSTKTLGAVGTILDALGSDQLVEHPAAIALLAKTTIMKAIRDRNIVTPPFTQTQRLQEEPRLQDQRRLRAVDGRRRSWVCEPLCTIYRIATWDIVAPI